MYTDLWSVKPSLLYMRAANIILKDSKLYGLTPLYLIFTGLLILFIAVTIKYSNKGSWNYIVYTVVAIIAFVLLFLGWLAQAKIVWVTVVALVLVMSWCAYTFMFYFPKCQFKLEKC